jgi:HlyD family secretion protein
MNTIDDPRPAAPAVLPPAPPLTEDWADTSPRRPLWRRLLPWVLLGAGVIVAAAWWWWSGQPGQGAPRYQTERVTRGTLQITVVANGTLAPTRAVSVGSELSGTVARVLVDINDRVRKGQLLVELDTSRLQDEIARAQAAEASARARVAQTAATLQETRAQAARKEDVWQLSGGKVPSAAELDAARAAVERAVADAAASQAAVADAQAGLHASQTNLGKASIRAPIDGVILTRAVDPGNAVAASLQAVTLFTIAEDLRRMKLQVNVDEADVGQVREGQTAHFSVSAWPRRSYPARITRVGFGSTTKENVVSYLTDLEVANDDLSLRPGMTATATIAAVERPNVLLVPNAALRFTPSSTAQPATGSASFISRLMPRMPFGSGQRRTGPGAGSGAASGQGAPRQVWLLRDGSAVPTQVTPGLSNGRLTEVSGALQEGESVIVDQLSKPP